MPKHKKNEQRNSHRNRHPQTRYKYTSPLYKNTSSKKSLVRPWTAPFESSRPDKIFPWRVSKPPSGVNPSRRLVITHTLARVDNNKYTNAAAREEGAIVRGRYSDSREGKSLAREKRDVGRDRERGKRARSRRKMSSDEANGSQTTAAEVEAWSNGGACVCPSPRVLYSQTILMLWTRKHTRGSASKTTECVRVCVSVRGWWRGQIDENHDGRGEWSCRPGGRATPGEPRLPRSCHWHRVRRQGPVFTQARQFESAALHLPADNHCAHGLDLQAQKIEVPPRDWTCCHLRWVWWFWWAVIGFWPLEGAQNCCHMFLLRQSFD